MKGYYNKKGGDFILRYIITSKLFEQLLITFYWETV